MNTRLRGLGALCIAWCVALVLAGCCAPVGERCETDSNCCQPAAANLIPSHCIAGTCESCLNTADTTAGRVCVVSLSCCPGLACSGGQCVMCLAANSTCVVGSGEPCCGDGVSCRPSSPGSNTGTCSVCTADGGVCHMASECCGGTCSGNATVAGFCGGTVACSGSGMRGPTCCAGLGINAMGQCCSEAGGLPGTTGVCCAGLAMDSTGRCVACAGDCAQAANGEPCCTPGFVASGGVCQPGPTVACVVGGVCCGTAPGCAQDTLLPGMFTSCGGTTSGSVCTPVDGVTYCNPNETYPNFPMSPCGNPPGQACAYPTSPSTPSDCTPDNTCFQTTSPGVGHCGAESGAGCVSRCWDPVTERGQCLCAGNTSVPSFGSNMCP